MAAYTGVVFSSVVRYNFIKEIGRQGSVAILPCKRLTQGVRRLPQSEGIRIELYDEIGVGYKDLRKPDPRIAQAIEKALGKCKSIMNVGAGAGSYEPQGRDLVAVEPSLTMIRQRAKNAPPAIQASATNLPFKDHSFDASTAILTVHHWPNWIQGLEELARSTKKKIVILTWDPSAEAYWLTKDYFPDIIDIDRGIFPDMSVYHRALGRITVKPVLIPHDCKDGFLGAYWRRPDAYLIPEVQRSISTFSKIKNVTTGMERLRKDLIAGAWHRKYGHLLKIESLDLGYRLITAG